MLCYILGHLCARKHHIFTSRTATYLFSQIYHTWLGTISTSRSQEALVTGKHSTRMGLFSWESLWRSGLERVAVRLHKTGGLYASLEVVTGKARADPPWLPKGPDSNSHHSEKIRIPNEKLFTVALVLSASLLLLLVISTPSACRRTSPPAIRWQTLYRQQTRVAVPSSRLEQCLEHVKSGMLIREVLGCYFLTVPFM